MSDKTGPEWFLEGLDLDNPLTAANRLTVKAVSAFSWQDNSVAHARTAVAQCLYLQHIAATLDDIRDLLIDQRRA